MNYCKLCFAPQPCSHCGHQQVPVTWHVTPVPRGVYAKVRWDDSEKIETHPVLAVMTWVAETYDLPSISPSLEYSQTFYLVAWDGSVKDNTNWVEDKYIVGLSVDWDAGD